MLSMGLENNTQKRIRTFLTVFALIVGSLTIGILGLYHYRKIWSTDNMYKFASPNDLYAMHDIVLTGYAAPFMKDGSVGRDEVREAVSSLTRDLLPILHPIKRCRDEIERVVTNRETLGSDLELVVQSADMLWSCLPAKFQRKDFKHPFTRESLLSSRAMLDSRHPVLLRRSAVQACRHSPWDRTCSYWSSIHSLALRAEQMLALQRQNTIGREKFEGVSFEKFLPLLLTTMIGGLTQCRG